MAVKKVLVMGASGHPEQLQAGDSINVATTTTEVETLTNGGGSSVPIGTPVYISAADTFLTARANASGTAKLHGLIYDASIASASAGSVATDGVVTATTTQWDAITGQTGGLTAGADYFLDAAAAGKLTSTPPSTAGQYNVYVGRAKSTTDMHLDIRFPIAL
jgi:hypothetical protein